MNPSNKSIATVTQTTQKTLLLVDDDLSVLEMVGRVLAGEGYRVLCAATGPEALHIAEENPIDAVLLDLNMPGQSGWDTFEQLTARDPTIAVVIITARANQIFTALGAGVGALVEKPVDFPTLIKTVKTLIEESPETRVGRLAGHRTNFHYLPSNGKGCE